MITTDFAKGIALEFLEIKDFFQKVGFEIIGSRDINDEKIYLIKKKK